MGDFDAALMGFQIRVSQSLFEAAQATLREITQAQEANARAKAEAKAATMRFEAQLRAVERLSGA